MMKLKKLIVLIFIVTLSSGLKAQQISPYLFGQNHWIATGDEGNRIGNIEEYNLSATLENVKLTEDKIFLEYISKIEKEEQHKNFNDIHIDMELLWSIQGDKK